MIVGLKIVGYTQHDFDGMTRDEVKELIQREIKRLTDREASHLDFIDTLKRDIKETVADRREMVAALAETRMH